MDSKGLEQEVTVSEAAFRVAPREHGGNIYAAASRYELNINKMIDFSSNANPSGPASSALKAAKKAIELVGRYPDPELAELRAAAAKYFGIRPAHIACGSGVTTLLHMMPRVFRPKTVLVPLPSFSEYDAAARLAGCEIVTLPLRHVDGFRIDPVELAPALKGVDMLFLANPHNPTGRLLLKAELMEIVQYCVAHSVTVILDESYIDFTESESVAKDVVQYRNVVCLRSFEVFFGMPGLRVAYAVAHEETAAAIREHLDPWAISIPAEKAAIAVLDDWGFIKNSRKQIVKERDRLLSALRIMPGIEPFPSETNFILIKSAVHDSHLLPERLAARGLLVRGGASIPGLGGEYFRIAVRSRWDNRRLIKTLRALLIQK